MRNYNYSHGNYLFDAISFLHFHGRQTTTVEQYIFFDLPKVHEKIYQGNIFVRMAVKKIIGQHSYAQI